MPYPKPMICPNTVSGLHLFKTNSETVSSALELGNITAKVKGIYYNREFLGSTTNIPDSANFGILLDRTSFYAEAGGQEYDTGNIVIDGACDFEVTNVQVYSGYVLHTGHLKYGQLNVGDEVISSYDELRRWPLRSNHTATHILNFCLREVLGDHIDQKGSLVAPTKLRFDFSHKAQIALPELAKIESMSVDWIRKNVKVYSRDVDLKSGFKIPGLRAVFGEAYPDPVRVVVLGYDVDDITKDLENPRWRSTSIEFCGGTHVAKTGDIKDFAIIEESGIAKGIRRITAITGQEAQEATRVANEFKSRLDVLETSSGNEKDAGLKALTVVCQVIGCILMWCSRTSQELGQADISVLVKADLKERLGAIRKAFDKQIKEKEAAVNKSVCPIALRDITGY